MDVKYRPEPWQNMGDGMNRITKDALMKLRDANESLKRIDGRIRDLDSDGSIHFSPKDQSQKIGELLDSYSTLQKYCGEAGRLVSEHIDKPFLVEMDKFAQKMRDTSILSFETNNRIGSTTTTVLPDAHAGYGSVPQTIQTKKDKITVEDIFKDSPAFDNVLKAEYKELKKQNPDAKLNYEEYKKVVPSTRGFEYKSIEDEQKKLEMIRDIGIGAGIIITTILCPPLGAAAAVVYGAVQIKSGIDGEDWGTHRKLSQEERVGNIIFGGLDAIPVVGAVGKGVKAFKGTSELADLAKLLKFKEGMPGFNPNLGKNVVQSLKENKTLKNALDAMKNTPIPVAVRTVDTGIGMKLPYIESSTVGEVAGKFSKASTAAKDDAYQLAKGTGNTVSNYLDDIVEAGSVNATKMNKLKNAIQNNTFSVDELSEISKKMSDLGINKEYNEALIKLDFGKYLRGLIGDPPTAMIDPHAHHILFKKGLGEAQQKLVQEGQELLRKYGIDPIIGKENLVWAPNRVAGQHSIAALENVVNQLKAVDAAGADLDDIIEILEDLGKQAASRK
ncbi:AHH domain-containing protein [Bacillus sp. EKM202B]|nr:AHH domain-containing protein [Bacillus sp. EKM202B]KAF6558870.1 AHH domain-containing protein [Bacillus sp. EKM202B]